MRYPSLLLHLPVSGPKGTSAGNSVFLLFLAKGTAIRSRNWYGVLPV